MAAGVPIRRPVFQGTRRRVGIGFSLVIVISDGDHFSTQRQIGRDRLR
jgi:hypothetical protein